MAFMPLARLISIRRKLVSRLYVTSSGGSATPDVYVPPPHFLLSHSLSSSSDARPHQMICVIRVSFMST